MLSKSMVSNPHLHLNTLIEQSLTKMDQCRNVFTCIWQISRQLDNMFDFYGSFCKCIQMKRNKKIKPLQDKCIVLWNTQQKCQNVGNTLSAHFVPEKSGYSHERDNYYNGIVNYKENSTKESILSTAICFRPMKLDYWLV